MTEGLTFDSSSAPNRSPVSSYHLERNERSLVFWEWMKKVG